MEIDKFHLSLVSGGKPSLARSAACNKSTILLSDDLTHYIVPFNNQIKVYSTETRQCVKTIKYPNHEVLNTVFCNDDATIIHISMGDILAGDNNEDHISVVTSNGHVLVLNLKGKLVESPKHVTLEIATGEIVTKVLSNAGSEYKLLCHSRLDNNLYNYRLYDCGFSNDAVTLQETKVLNNVQLINWSNNEQFLAYLAEEYPENSNKSKKFITSVSVFDESLESKFELNSVLPSGNISQSSNARNISTLAIDNEGAQLALGFVSGVITIVQIEDLQIRLLKWHIDSVLSLSFTDDSTYLLSGGWEKVLSFWQLSSNLQQFLPRLNGVIVDIETVGKGKYYSLTLQLTENVSSADYQILLLNATDLTSKLSISGPLPVFSSTTKNGTQPVSAMNTKTSDSVASSAVSKKKQKKKLLKNKRQDFTVSACVNPVSKQIFFPHVSAVQSYDFYKNEPVSYQYMTSSTTAAMGKVRSELNIQEPSIIEVQFTKSGKWMITQEVEFPPADLPSSKDLSYVLKFWEKSSVEEQWNLKTKVLNPHGLSIPITKILVAPQSVNSGEGCLTADNNGGLKFWAFDEHEKNWCLKKLSLPNFNHFSNSVSLAWSSDGSLVFHGFDDKLQILDFDTLRKFDSPLCEFNLDFGIQAILLSNDTTLIVATKTTLYAIDVLQGEITYSYDLYPFIDGVYKNSHMSRLITCNYKTGQIALAVNQQCVDESNNKTLQYRSNIIIFSSDLSEKVGSYQHDEYIAWIEWNHDSDFFFLDIQSRLGVVGVTVSTEMSDEVNNEGVFDNLASEHGNFHDQLRKLTSVKAGASQGVDEDQQDIDLEFINGNFANKAINMNSFTSMMDNIQNIQMDTLFDRVMKVLK
ncbi:NET1-associated nuclear protein 1 [Nakaseomyces bracarensis]|uniref:NET1-associated nuclear protein 1 n=1 Tax=Nakaseomyces bracarensis TaxID=273131 RepID=A0ABR4NU26_9SACH